MTELSTSRLFIEDGFIFEDDGDNSKRNVAPLGLKRFHPHPLLSDIVEDIWDWDVADGAVARSLTIKLPPSAYAFLVLQHRGLLVADWTFGAATIPHESPRHIAVKMHSGLITVRQTGPIGTVIVRIKPEMADRLTRVSVSELLNQKIDLYDVFDRHALARVEDELERAPNVLARVALVQDLLLRELRPLRPTNQLTQAALRLRFDPSLSVRDLASQLDISARHLSRGFTTMFGTGPKRFARLVRIEKAFAARRDGFGWSQIAHGCGFTDQAHLIHDFQAIAGAAPEDIFRMPGTSRNQLLQAPCVSPFFNLFVG